MTAPGHMSSTIRGDRHGVSARNLLAQYPQLAHISRLSISPDNTLHRKLGLGDSLESRDPKREWIPAFEAVTQSQRKLKSGGHR
jgi:hypothetical protein